jgi:flagellar biosynthetic protein FliP
MALLASAGQPAPAVPVGLGGGAELAAAAVGFALLPAALALCTCFPRIFVTLSILRQGLGIGAVPSNLIVLGLSAALTMAAMAPTLKAAWDGGLSKLAGGAVTDPVAALQGAEGPLRAFMFEQLQRQNGGPTLEAVLKARGTTVAPGQSLTRRDVDTLTLAPAFALNEIRVAFMLGFKVLLPFLAIDLAVAAVLASLGLFMTPPSLVSLPLKLLLFVAVDGWTLVSTGLVGGIAKSAGAT